MIVEPDFLTHWKTQMLVVELDDPAAPLYVIALWAHCQLRKTALFTGLSDNALKAICRFPGDAVRFRAALVASGFLDEKPNGFEVHGWAEANAKLVANWVNGRTGGRGKKGKNEEPTGNPAETQKKPTGNPSAENENPPGTDREDKIEKIEDTPLPPSESDEVKPLCTIAQALEVGQRTGMSEGAVRYWWRDRHSRGWRRGGEGSPLIRSWQSDLTNSADWAEKRAAELKSAGTSGSEWRPRFPGEKPPKP